MSAETVNRIPEQEALHNEVDPALQAVESLQLSSNSAERAQQVNDAMTAENLLTVLTMVHEGVAPDVAHVPSAIARNIVDPRSGEATTSLARPEERLPLFTHAAELVKGLYGGMKPGEEQLFLNRSANIIALSGVLAHTFEDGNGRTSRTLAHAIREGSQIDESNIDTYAILAGNRPEAGYKINSYVPSGEGKNLSAADLLDRVASIEIPLSETQEYESVARKNFNQPYNEAG